MKTFSRSMTGMIAAAILGATALLPISAQASEAGRRNTTLGVGAITGYLLLNHKWIPAAAAGVGTYYAYKNYQAAINARHRKQQQEQRVTYINQNTHNYHGYPVYQPVRVMINGRQANFNGVPAMVTNGHTMVPMAGVFQDLGANVRWNPNTSTVTATRQGQNIRLRVGSRYATVNGSQVYLDSPAEMVNGHVLVPLRFVSQALGANVRWNQNTNTASIVES